jgi:dynein heavy chain 2
MKLDNIPSQVKKILQFHEACNQRMGVVIVGPGGCGKSTCWSILRAALKRLNRNVVQYTINPKAMPRQQLLGHMDLDTREWFDGVLTAAARQVVKETLDTHSWIICDGDIDPEWIESLNSVLDDNRLLTMPNGGILKHLKSANIVERIQFGTNVNFIFETHSLKWASPATVSRMGMIFLSDSDIDIKAQVNSWLKTQPEDIRGKLEGWIDSYFYRGVEYVSKDLSALMVDTTQGGIVGNGLSHLKGVSTKGEFVSAVIRGLGSNLDIEKRTNFAKDVFSWVGESPVDKRRPLSCYWDTKTLSYRSYDVESTQEISRSQLPKEPVIITSDVRANADFLLPWLRNADPFIVVGPEGAGKSMLLRYCFQQLKSTSVATVHCSSQTAASHVIQKLSSATITASSIKGRVLRPKVIIVIASRLNIL